MSFIVNSIPKSGTYLVEKFLTEMGIPSSGLHFRNDRVWLFKNAPMQDIVSDPSKFLVWEPLARSLQRLRSGECAVAHLHDPKDCLALFERHDIRSVFLIRDLRDCLISHMRFVSNPKRTMRPRWIREGQTRSEGFRAYLEGQGADYFTLIAQQLDWLDTNTPVLRYEDLTGTDRPHAAATILSAFGIKADGAVETLNRCIGAPTRTFSGESAPRDVYMSPAAEEIFREIGVADANRRLGYLE
jgi:sulfotransferase family protein